MMRRRIVPVVVSLVAFLSIAAPAWAHYLESGWQWTGRSDTSCAKGFTQVSHGSEKAIFIGATEIWDNVTVPLGGHFYCSGHGSGNLKTRVHVWKWNHSRQKWGICRDSGYLTSGGFRHTVRYNYYSSYPCGVGYYTTASAAYIYNDGWRGGWVAMWDWSPNEWYHNYQ